MNIIQYQLYLLQIENYEIHRYFKLLLKKGYFKPNAPTRKSLVWTKKIILILSLALILLVLGAYLALNISMLFGVIWITVSILCLPFYYALAVYVLYPFDVAAKHYLINKAKKYVRSVGGLKIIGIAGSYGKTTLKNVLFKILSQKFNVSMPSGNINTALGISSWVLKNNLKGKEILLVEFGEEYPGDNKQIAQIFPQDITVIAGINEAHFERMGSLENTASTIFEALESTKRGSQVYLNGDDENVIKYHTQFVKDGNHLVYDSHGCDDVKIMSKVFEHELLSWKTEYSKIGSVEIKNLAEYIMPDVAVASHIGINLGLSKEEIKAGIANLIPVEHRLQPIVNEASGVLVIDDSYNGNPTGALEAIKALSLFKGRRKIYLTPGLVEAGSKNRQIHEEIGAHLSAVADLVILIKNTATPHIAKGLLTSGFKKENIIWYETALEAHSALGSILKPDDVILFQNDWGDQYL